MSPVTAIEPKSYWNLDTVRSAQPTSIDRNVPSAQRLRSLVDDAVQKHLIADVPLGVFLSSGIDSTALAAIASQTRTGLQTTRIISRARIQRSRNRAADGQAVRTDHREILISGEDMVMRMDEAIESFDQPSMDGINTYFVSWAARQAGLKVVLSGLGSDKSSAAIRRSA